MNLQIVAKMSRRKQAKPNRLNEEEEEEQRAGLFNGRAKMARMEGEKEDYEDDQEMEEEHSGGEEGNNNSQPGELKEKLLALSLGSLPPLLPLDCEEVEPREQLQEVARSIDQLKATIAGVASPGSLQELSVLQASLLSLQQQQLRQFRLLTSVQQQEGGELGLLAEKLEIHNPFVTQMLEKQQDEREEERASSPPRQMTMRPGLEIFPQSSCSLPITSSYQPLPASKAVLEPVTSSGQDSLSSLANMSSAIITHHEPMQDRPVNTLELLQQKSASILQSASMGILANNLADLSSTPHPGSNHGAREDEGRVKHKCRYCGKVFGSESALSIHIRSHTGERPYKCNICGNRFTTKGNLKVHFQRHSDRFPAIKMNPNMVLEHLDKFYPALLQQCEEAEKKGAPMPDMNNPMAGMAPVVPPGMTLPPNLPGMTPPLSPAPILKARPLKAPLQPPTTPKMPLTMGALPRYPCLPTVPIKREDIFKERPSWLKGFPLLERPPLERSFDNDLKPGEGGFIFKHEIKEEVKYIGRPPPMELLLPQYPLPRFRIESLSPRSADTASVKRTGSVQDEVDQEEDRGQKCSEGSESESGSFQDEPENLSNGKRDIEDEEEMESGRQSLFDNFPKLPSGGMRSPFPQFDPTKDPNIYNVLLPRPGSTDNSWESLIEVDKSNEATKLETLVNAAPPANGDGKGDPNECILCRRVLSCKSALQMHYRIHTGERPFKCKICNRTFTTKGNLKTHMGVHRTKPPMRSFPQCPVCHKKYANSLVLQQHIKTHTGEKTEMTLEQISAAEIRDFQPGDGPNIPFGLPTIRPPGDPLNKFLPQFPLLPSPRGLLPYDEEQVEERLSRPSSVSSSASVGSNLTSSGAFSFPSYHTSFSASLAALEKQVRGMDREERREEVREEREQVRDITPEPEGGEEPQDLSRREEREEGEEEREEEREEEEELRRGTSSRSSNEGGSSPSPHILHRAPLHLPPGFPSGMPQLPPGFPHLFPPLPFPMHGLAPLPGPTPPGFPLGLSLPPGFPAIRHPMLMEDIFAARGKTTCQICFKVFACNSALEIHMRSHTKERPFKCDVCGKGFTTKGNMKQHQMTHKFREPGSEDSCTGEPGPMPCPSSSPPAPTSPHPSSPLTSPPSSDLSPPYRGEKRPGEEQPNSLQPEKRAILCG